MAACDRRGVKVSGSVITGWGTALPEKVVTNAEFEARLDTTDAWIVERTGIRERRFGGTTSSLAIEAGAAAITKAGLSPGDIDLLLLATTTPDKTVPATSSTVHAQLGCSGAAFDLNAACAGYVYAAVTADAMLGARIGFDRALVIGADTLSVITDMEDRSTAVLFADGAGAVVIEYRDDAEPFILASDLGLDGSLLSILYCDHGGFLKMEGREVFRRAVRATVDSAVSVLKQAGVAPDEIALFVPHQANSASSTRCCSTSEYQRIDLRSSSTPPATPRLPPSPSLSRQQQTKAGCPTATWCSFRASVPA